MKTIEYPLLALTLTAQECAHIMAPILFGGLPACGICQYFPRSVTYAPIMFQGIGLHNIYVTMGIFCIEIIIQEGPSNSITGDLIRTTIEAAKLEIGLGTSLFQMDYSNTASYQPPHGLPTPGASCMNLISTCQNKLRLSFYDVLVTPF